MCVNGAWQLSDWHIKYDVLSSLDVFKATARSSCIWDFELPSTQYMFAKFELKKQVFNACCLVSEQPLNKRRTWRRRRGNKKEASQINVTWTEAMDWSPFPWPRSNPHWSHHPRLHSCLLHFPCRYPTVVYEGLCVFNLLSSFGQMSVPCLKVIHMVS